MTLFITTPNQRLEISDAYFMALSFLISYGLTKISMSVVESLLEKQKRRNAKNVSLANPRGGIGFEVYDDT